MVSSLIRLAIIKYILFHAQVCYSDTLKLNWGIKNSEAEKAWRLTKGNKKVTVAVIDTGVDIHHPRLKEKIWINRGEIPGNGIDDDKNGFIDDVKGWNFVGRNGNVSDYHGHGTHIAGIINDVTPQVSLMVLKYYDPKISSRNTLDYTIAAIHYAVNMGADIINYSSGGYGFDAREEAALRLAREKGILVVAAAGNNGTNSDFKKYYPAGYGFNNIISVTAIDSNKTVLDSSNYGKSSVDIAAPGNHIYSTLPGGRYGYMTGTSQATAFVTGAAVLLLAKEGRKLLPPEVRQRLIAGGRSEESLNQKTRLSTRLSSYRSLVIRGRETDRTVYGLSQSLRVFNQSISQQ